MFSTISLTLNGEWHGNTMVHAQEGLTGLAGQTGVGTIDFEAPLPYRGKEGEYLEFQNLSVNGDKYPKALM